MANKIDYMLRDLEKQIQDFTMSINGPKSTEDLEDQTTDLNIQNLKSPNIKDNLNSDDTPLQLYKNRITSDEESGDDDVTIGTILKRSATARRPVTKEQPVTLTQSKSLRNTTGRNKRDELTLEDDEIRFAMQKALAVLNNNEQIETSESKNAEDQQNKLQRAPTMPVKTVTTRIYIDDGSNNKVVQLTNLYTTAMIIHYLRRKGLLDTSDDWTLFEIDNQHGVERPLREWEIVLENLSTWDVKASNAILAKKYSYHYTLTPDSILQKKILPMHGWLSIEYKPGKWQKRYFFIKDNAIHHAKDNKGSSSSILCHLVTYDVYTLLQPLKASPTPFVFSIRAQDKPNIFERESDYMRYLAAENQEDMESWVLGLRYAKSQIHYQQHPSRVTNPLAPISVEVDSSTLRRHKSLKEINASSSKPSDDHTKHPLPKNEPMRRQNEEKRLVRNGPTGRSLHRNSPVLTTDNPHSETSQSADGVDASTFAKGSLLAKELSPEQILFRQQQQQQQQQQQNYHYYHNEDNGNTLIQIDQRIKFSKGSLLDQKENKNFSNKIVRSKSAREPSTTTSPEDQHRRHTSLRRKQTSNKKHHDVPLPNNPNIASMPSSIPPSATLLQLNDNPEKTRGRQVKPLLSFDEKKK